MTTVKSIGEEDLESAETEQSGEYIRVRPSTVEKSLGLEVWNKWDAHFRPDISHTDTKAGFHIKHPFTDGDYRRVKLMKVKQMSDQKFQQYLDLMGKAGNNDELGAYPRYDEDGDYQTFAFEALVDMLLYLVQDGFKVTVTQNVLQKYQEEYL